MKQERTTGRRRSTSRKKAKIDPDTIVDPEPSQDRFSPQPEPDPGVPPHNANAESAPTSEEGHSSSPAAPLPNCSPKDESQGTPQSPSQVHSPKAAPDPAEEGQAVLSHSPTPMEVVHSPSPVAMEMDEDKAIPAAPSLVEQSPAPSPCSTPPVSPFPQLEDEDSLSPLFQRSLSEDSGGSPTPSLGDTKKR